jgi:HEAT repeat protein
MMMLKRLSILMITALCAVSMVMGQSSDSEMSIEESYLQEAIELMIIRETSRGDSREQKLLALEYIGDALERGSTNEELRTTLEYLSLEGTQNRVTQGGRLTNNYPEVRRQAARYLGTVGTKEAKDALIRVCTSDNEPMVLQEVIKSLGTIGINENDDAVGAIVWVVNKFNSGDNPDQLLAIAAIDTLEKLAKKYRKVDGATIQVIARIAEGPYYRVVQDRAKQALVNLRRYAAAQQQQG